MLIRLQAKEITGKLSNIYHSAITHVENVSNKTPAFTGTVISKCFIESRSHSWQAHLSRISAYLVSKNVWWKAAPNSFVFFDGDKDLECRVEGPTLNHYRSCSIEDIEKQSVKNWKQILENEIELPTHILHIFDENGDFVSYQTNQLSTCTTPNISMLNPSESLHMLESHVDESIHIMSCNNSEHIMLSPTPSTTVIDLSPIPNTCKATPPPVGLPLSSTPSSSQTQTTPSRTKSLSKQSTDNEMEENCKIVTV